MTQYAAHNKSRPFTSVTHHLLKLRLLMSPSLGYNITTA